jgi:hypothetical protein
LKLKATVVWLGFLCPRICSSRCAFRLLPSSSGSAAGEEFSVEAACWWRKNQAFVLSYLGNGFRRTSKRKGKGGGADDRASDVQASSQDKCMPYAKINITVEKEELQSFLFFSFVAVFILKLFYTEDTKRNFAFTTKYRVLCFWK